MSWRWPNEAKLALSLVVNVEEGAEQNLADGDRGPEPVDELGVMLKKPVRNYGNESNYAYGINEGAPRVLNLLQKYGMSATFTAAAVALERAPHVAQRIAADGSAKVLKDAAQYLNPHVAAEKGRGVAPGATIASSSFSSSSSSGWTITSSSGAVSDAVAELTDGLAQMLRT